MKLAVLPDLCLNANLFANQRTGYTLQTYACPHDKIRPAYEDIYQVDHSRPIVKKRPREEVSFFDYKFNMELYKYLSSTDNPSFAVLKYLSQGQELPEPVVELLDQKLNLSVRRLSVADFKFNQDCSDCIARDCAFVARRIVIKALVMSILQRGGAEQHLIDRGWFQAFSSYLLIDAPIDKFVRQKFFNYDFVARSPLPPVKATLAGQRQRYGSDNEIASNDYVRVSQLLFDFLCDVYDWGFSLKLVEGDIILNQQYSPKFPSGVGEAEQRLW